MKKSSIISIIVLSVMLGIPNNTLANIEEVWSSSYGAGVSSVSVESWDNIISDEVGNIFVTGLQDGRAIFAKYDAERNLLWVKEIFDMAIAGEGIDIMTTDSSGNLLLVDNVSPQYQPIQSHVMKFDPEGELIWTAGFDNPFQGGTRVEDIHITGSGDLYLAGVVNHYPYSYYWGGDSSRVFAVAKYDQDGDETWTSILEPADSSMSIAYDVNIDTFGDVLVTGVMNDSCIVAKFGDDGDQLWVRTFKDSTQYGSKGLSIDSDESGNVYVAGTQVYVPWSGSESLAMKLDANGEVVWLNGGDVGSFGSSISTVKIFDTHMDGSLDVVSTTPFIMGGCGGMGSSSSTQIRTYSTEGLITDLIYHGTQADMLHRDDQGYLYLIGQHSGWFFLPPTSVVAKLDPSGEESWSISTDLYGYEVYQSFSMDPAGNLLVAGNLYGDANITCIGSDSGDVDFEVEYTGIIGDREFLQEQIILDTGESYALTQSRSNGGSIDASTITKLNADGSLQWRVVDDREDYSIGNMVADSQGRVTTLSVITQPYTELPTFEVNSYHSTGEHDWTYSFSDPSDYYGFVYGMEVDGEGNILLLTRMYDGDSYYVLQSLTPNGELSFTHVDSGLDPLMKVDAFGKISVLQKMTDWFRVREYDIQGSLIQTIESTPGPAIGRVIEFGESADGSKYFLTKSSYPKEIKVLKYDSTGSLNWTYIKTYSDWNDTPLSLSIHDNEVSFLMNVEGGLEVVKLTEEGTVMWTRHYHDTPDRVIDAKQSTTDIDGRIYLSYSYPEGDESQIGLLKYDLDGEILFDEALDVGENTHRISLDHEANIYVAGTIGLEGENQVVFKKFSQPNYTLPVVASNTPMSYALHPNHPNPFNPVTTLSFDLPEASDVRLQVYDVRGRLVASIVDGQQVAGVHSYQWNSLDQAGQPVSTGIYFARMEAGEFSKTVKMTLMK